MKLYDKVKLIKERAEYKQAGIKALDTGIIIGENKNGYVLVCFDGETYLDTDNVFKTTEKHVGIRIEDLELCD